MPAVGAASFPDEGRRAVVYRLSAARMHDDYVVIALRALREHATWLAVQLVEAPDDAPFALVADVADEVIVASDWGDPDLLGRRVEEGERFAGRFDEVILTDDSWFGPVTPLAPVLKRMDTQAVLAWTMTPALPREEANWLAIRRDGTATASWTRTLALVYEGAAVVSAFADGGEHPPDESPLLTRDSLAGYPPLLEKHGIVGRRILAGAQVHGYPSAAILQSLARSEPPNELNATLGLLEIVSTTPSALPAPAAGLLVLAHFARGTAWGELLRRLQSVPDNADVIATTDAADEADRLHAEISALRTLAEGALEVRTVPSGADSVSAVFVGCRDELVGDRYELVMKLHAAGVGPSRNAEAYLRRHTRENLFATVGYTARIIDFFRDPGLGAVFPATPNIGHDVLGAGWGDLRADVERLRRLLGVAVPLGAAPLMPWGGAWVARTEVLQVLAQRPWQWSDYTSEGEWSNLGRAQEALLAHAAGERGLTVRTALTAAHAEVSLVALAYTVDQLASTTTGHVADQIGLLHRLGPVGAGGIRDTLRMYRHARKRRST